jgi:hypothetical protein
MTGGPRGRRPDEREFIRLSAPRRDICQLTAGIAVGEIDIAQFAVCPSCIRLDKLQRRRRASNLRQRLRPTRETREQLGSRVPYTNQANTATTWPQTLGCDVCSSTTPRRKSSNRVLSPRLTGGKSTFHFWSACGAAKTRLGLIQLQRLRLETK